MVMAAEKDIVNPPEQARLLFDALTCIKAWHIQNGARHYDLYSPPHFDEVASSAARLARLKHGRVASFISAVIACERLVLLRL